MYLYILTMHPTCSRRKLESSVCKCSAPRQHASQEVEVNQELMNKHGADGDDSRTHVELRTHRFTVHTATAHEHSTLAR